MPRFTLLQLFMGMAFIAIIAVFTQTQGCGTHYAMIEAISFSSDDSRITVATLNGRDARTPGKLYMADLSRTISWLNVSTGHDCRIVHEDFSAGNRGPAFRFWRLGRTSALCNPSTDHIAMSAFGGGDVTLDADSGKPVVIALRRPAFNIAYSKSGRYLAASGMDELTVLDTYTGAVAMQVETRDEPFLSASQMSFSDCGTHVVVAGSWGVHVWDVPTSTRLSAIFDGPEPRVNDISVAPDDTVIVCSDDWIRRYTFAGELLTTLGHTGAYLCCVSADGQTLAVGSEGQLATYDVGHSRLIRTLPFDGATALAVSSDGNHIAVGDYRGNVTLVDVKTGKRQWIAHLPSRYRWPWTWPAAFLVGWVCVAWRLWRRSKIVEDARVEVSTGA